MDDRQVGLAVFLKWMIAGYNFEKENVPAGFRWQRRRIILQSTWNFAIFENINHSHCSVIVDVVTPMELDSQIETLEEIGFRFRDRKVIQKLLDCHAWWQYHESPFTLLMERLNFWAACNQTRLCLNLVSWDFKGLRHNGWFKSIATDLAELSSSQTGFKIANLTENREDDVWRMEYRLPSKLGPLTREIITRFPYKHASWLPVIEMAADFSSETTNLLFVGCPRIKSVN